MVEPPDVNRMPDQDTQHFQDRKRSAWSVSIGLQNPGSDPLTCQARHGAVALRCPERLDARGIANFGGRAQRKITCTAHIGGNEGANRPVAGPYILLVAVREAIC